jgi:hypothetical protein
MPTPRITSWESGFPEKVAKLARKLAENGLRKEVSPGLIWFVCKTG